jgi:hypothetical protein
VPGGFSSVSLASLDQVPAGVLLGDGEPPDSARQMGLHHHA